jgi:hypothetical protein
MADRSDWTLGRGLTWNGAWRKLEPLHKGGSRRFHDVFKHQSSSRNIVRVQLGGSRKWHRVITGNCKEAVRSRAGAERQRAAER